MNCRHSTSPQSRSSRRLGLLLGVLPLVMSSAAIADDDWSPESFNGVWLIERERAELRTEDGEVPPLLPGARAVYDANRGSLASGNTGFDRATWCASPGLPRLALVAYPFEILVNPLQVAFLYEWNRWARLVDLSGAEFEVLYPMSFGTASGRFEGETLVVETRGLMSQTVMDDYGMPHSDALVMTERYRLLGDGRLENRMRFEDPETFAEPWETVVIYRRLADARIAEDVCLDRIKQGMPAL
jgi:hypothetical protein